MKRKVKKRWVVLLAIVLFIYIDHLIAARNGERWTQAFKENGYEILAGEWEVCIGRKLASLSKVDEDFDVVPGIALVLDAAGNYTLIMSEEARLRFRRGGSRQFLQNYGESDPYSQFDPMPFTTNIVSGKYEIRISEKEGSMPIKFNGLDRFLVEEQIGMDDNLFYDAPLEDDDWSFLYILPKKPINYWDVIKTYGKRKKVH